MKKSLLLVSVAICLVAFGVSAQTISVNGTSGTISAGSSFVDTLSLTISGANTIGDVESVNILLRTLNGSGFFTVSNVSPISPFSATNAPPSNVSPFTTTGDTANRGFFVTTNAQLGEVGSNAPAGSNPVSATGTTTFNFENITFNSDPSTPAGVYQFSVSLGGASDLQGSFIDNQANQTFDINSAPVFTITIPTAVPEPSTWFAGIGAAAVIGYTMLRRRQTA